MATKRERHDRKRAEQFRKRVPHATRQKHRISKQVDAIMDRAAQINAAAPVKVIRPD